MPPFDLTAASILYRVDVRNPSRSSITSGERRQSYGRPRRLVTSYPKLSANHCVSQAYTVLVPPTRNSDVTDPGASDEIASKPSSGRSLHRMSPFALVALYFHSLPLRRAVNIGSV